MAKEQLHSIAWNIIGWNMKEPIIFKKRTSFIGCPFHVTLFNNRTVAEQKHIVNHIVCCKT